MLELDRSMKRFQQRQAPHVADEEHTAGVESGHGPFECPAQIVHVGEVLDHRVEDDEIELGGLDALKLSASRRSRWTWCKPRDCTTAASSLRAVSEKSVPR